MKQKITLVLMICYLVSVSGVAFGLHYCGGKLASVTLFDKKATCKMCAKMADKMADVEQHNTCCKDKKIEVKVKDNHQAAAKIVMAKLFEITLAIKPVLVFAPVLHSSPAMAFNVNKAPPDLAQPSLNILNCTFRI